MLEHDRRLPFVSWRQQQILCENVATPEAPEEAAEEAAGTKNRFQPYMLPSRTFLKNSCCRPRTAEGGTLRRQSDNVTRQIIKKKWWAEDLANLAFWSSTNDPRKPRTKSGSRFRGSRTNPEGRQHAFCRVNLPGRGNQGLVLVLLAIN